MVGQSQIRNFEYWRSRAEASRALAHETLDPISKQRLVVLAESFEALALTTQAHDTENRKALASAHGRR
jgi:hypothetical protein